MALSIISLALVSHGADRLLYRGMNLAHLDRPNTEARNQRPQWAVRPIALIPPID
jgi:hypothetical protein